MRHYFAMFYYSNQLWNTFYYRVLDTLDLSLETVEYSDFIHLVEEKFINACFINPDILKSNKKPYLPQQRMYYPFDFDIKNGEVISDGTKLIIRFFGKEYKLYYVKCKQHYRYVMFNDTILDYTRLGSDKEYITLSELGATKHILILYLNLPSELRIRISLNYTTGKVDINVSGQYYKGVFSKKDLFPRSLHDYLNYLKEDMEFTLSGSIKLNWFVKPDETAWLLQEAYKDKEKNKDLLTTIVALYLYCYTNTNSYINTEEYNIVLKDYESNIGLPKDPMTLVARYRFFNDGVLK